MYEHVKTVCKHIPPSDQPLQFHSGYFLNKPRIPRSVTFTTLHIAHGGYSWRSSAYQKIC